jgi:hypothetical protein
MKHLQLFEDYSSAPEGAQQIEKMIQEATNNFKFRALSDWDEEKIKNAFLMIKTKQEFDAVNKAISEAYEKIELAGGKKIMYPTTTGFSSHPEPVQGKTGYVVNDPDFDWLFEIYYICFSDTNFGKDESYRKAIISHLVNSKIVDLKAPLRKEMSPFADSIYKIHQGDWKYLGM